MESCENEPTGRRSRKDSTSWCFSSSSSSSSYYFSPCVTSENHPEARRSPGWLALQHSSCSRHAANNLSPLKEPKLLEDQPACPPPHPPAPSRDVSHGVPEPWASTCHILNSCSLTSTRREQLDGWSFKFLLFFLAEKVTNLRFKVPAR